MGSEFRVLELPKIPKEFDMLAEQDPYIKSTYQHLQFISQDKEKGLEYEARKKRKNTI